ncbi:MAG: hypothetical protein SGI91_12565 [Alphaproteobacteria bacterium]|nr:hypothetical protein [Alphaproteobacteria bacterium]
MRTLLPIGFVTLALASLAFAEGADKPTVKVSAAAQGGFGRVTFDWSDDVKGQGQIVDGVFVVRFDESFDADTELLARALDPYVALVRQDADGRTLRFALKGPVRLKNATQGTRVSFDLVPPSFAGDPPAPAAPDPTTQKESRQLVVRVTEREKTTRLLFDFPGKAVHAAKLADGKLTVTFSKEAKVDLKRFTQSPPGWVRGARSSVANGKLTVEFDVDREADFRDASNGDQIVLELSDPKTDSSAAAETAATSAPRILIPDQTADAVPAPPVFVAEKIAFKLPPRKGEAPPPVAAAAAEPAQPTTVVEAADAKLAAHSDAAAITVADHAPDPHAPVASPTDPSPLPPALRLGQSDLEAALSPLPAATAAVPGQARAEIFGSMLRLELPYSKLPPAAVFRRGLAIWFVASSGETMDLSALANLPNAPARVLSTPTEIAPGITAFRLEAPASMSVSTSAAGNSWVIAIGNTVPDMPAQLQLVRQTSGTNTKMRAYLPGVQQVVWVRDPQTQDRLAAVLSYAPARGLATGRSFVEFAALPSQQGLAVQAIADDVTVTVEGTDAVIARPSGLNISDAQFARAVTTDTPTFASGESPAYVDFAAWGKPIAETRAEAVRKLMRLSAGSPGGMSAPRMSLARYYIAEGFAAEGLGVLGNIAREDQTAEATPAFRVTRAVANLMMARPREALTDLSMEALGNDAHAALWRGLAAAGVRDWRLARSNLMTATKILNRYPPVWQARARTSLAEAALALNEPSSATQALAGMPQGPLPADVEGKAKLVRAQLDVVSNKIDAAITAYDDLASSSYKPIAVRAKLEGTVLKSQKGKIKPEQAIDALERLRYQWRGDETELKTLTELGKLYVENNRVRDGLNTMRLAVRHFANSDEARATAAQMGKMFEGLFLAGKADDLPPVQALALFYDYRELTPVGSQGDEMIRKLADRLVSVDLLPQAAELLQHQVSNRLEGIGKASVATRLALIYLLDRKAEKALATIRDTKQTRLPDDLIEQRNLIEGRALADLKMYDDALDLVAADMTPEADRLRADIYWDAQRWPDAAAKAETMLGTRYQDVTAMTQTERDDLMRACVAYSLAGDGASLERLRTRYEAKMSLSPDAKAFAVVTRSPDVTGDDYKSLVKRVSSADTLSAFLQDFRARYGTGGVANNALTTTPAAAVTPPTAPATTASN